MGVLLILLYLVLLRVAYLQFVFQVLGPHLKDSKNATDKIAAFMQSVER
ncbi:hypothetical protein [Paraglaciecola psychrophila]|uniref:Uncharacterized protein n=1 Tax=Paraglaciecola psychrophila 170 TaxID=1129794 RepID=K6ZVD6_9ALTE|nr:hypothetical protein [Paraglaciecola psychrophila]AGH43503.1 hypothetical protein C427_1394 [Paraglaciecola psychrophila 170]GAC39821.1 hypothetical protein GPSY_4210 [Paraglaciecola psychrophila 170]